MIGFDFCSCSTPNIAMNWETSTGTPFNYFTYGAAVTEVEIDCLTGDHQVKLTTFLVFPCIRQTDMTARYSLVLVVR